ncbi:MAG TPA: hypothetical protein DDX91_06770 [Ruminococcaceae bacterium]|nr:hypothetical protein [Oscillospiraceae bacterium]
MLNLLKKKKTEKDREREELLSELEKLTELIKENELLFNLSDDSNMLEAMIYEQKSLQARYIYLLETAKKKGVKIDYIERIK